ncbi:hypothetical protein PQ459_10105 [Chryseobacterium sp. KACC 21268]|nr:hypothetical protein PQ459_10105 [Chryseobacterium sp. KACC 21268]
MCNCKNKVGFKQKLKEAEKLTKETGDLHVVYVHKATDTIFVRKETDLNDDLKICCYFTPDGKEVLYVQKTDKEKVETTDEIKENETPIKKKDRPKAS